MRTRLFGVVLMLPLIIGGLTQRAIGSSGQIALSAFTANAHVDTFTPGFTPVADLVPGPITQTGFTLTSNGTVRIGSGSQPYETYFDIENNSTQSKEFSNIAGASQGNVAVDNATKSDILIDFTDPQTRAGLLLADLVADSWTITAYDTDLTPLGSFTVSNTAGEAVFAGFQAANNNLGRLEISQSVDNGYVTTFDDIRFEQIVVPEPTSLTAIGTMLLLMARPRRYGRCRNRKIAEGFETF